VELLKVFFNFKGILGTIGFRVRATPFVTI
jgi:hypothetical protein